MENCTLLQKTVKELKNKKELHSSHHRMETDQVNLGYLQISNCSCSTSHCLGDGAPV